MASTVTAPVCMFTPNVSIVIFYTAVLQSQINHLQLIQNSFAYVVTVKAVEFSYLSVFLA